MTQKACFHCGDDVIGKGIVFEEKSFCCSGCKSVYQLLSSNELGGFYNLEAQAGVRPKVSNKHKYAFLDVDSIKEKYVAFKDEKSTHVTLFLPTIHCSSCIYLLENINKIEPRITSCQVNFAKREAAIVFDSKLQLSELALTLDRIGYPPNFGKKADSEKKVSNRYLYKLGVAGFAFGSIMLWTFPEYLGIENDNPEFRLFTSWLSFIVSLPVILYSANEYLISAYKAIKHKSINLDVPISIGILALYAQSCYAIFSGTGSGYMDSFAGFIFFLLIGKWFQSKTYKSLSFDRDYTAYFPVAITKIDNGEETIVEIAEIEENDSIIIRNQEVIPCDSILDSEEIRIDYSFVTGESNPIKKKKGDFIYAGGKLLGKKSSFIVQKKSDRSHLTQLWNEVNKKSTPKNLIADKLSIYFLIAVLIIAFAAGISWYFIDPSRITEIVVSVLIVACPCALALSKPFTHGNIMRALGRKKLYLKNTSVIEDLNRITDIVFDKTGTLTTGSSDDTSYSGKVLNQQDINNVLLVANSSTHPLSRSIVKFLKPQSSEILHELTHFEEFEGKGICGQINSQEIKIGSKSFTDCVDIATNETASYLSIDGNYIGRFIFNSEFRPGITALLNELTNKYRIHILSGDRDMDKSFLTTNIPTLEEIHFNQTPQSKLDYIKELSNRGKEVLMIGDGLNDSGALDQSTVGIAISEDVFRFTPSSDAILEAKNLAHLSSLLDVANYSKLVLILCYSFSVIYNVAGLTFALSGNLTPLIAAILMPLSSISIVLISTICTASK